MFPNNFHKMKNFANPKNVFKSCSSNDDIPTQSAQKGADSGEGAQPAEISQPTAQATAAKILDAKSGPSRLTPPEPPKQGKNKNKKGKKNQKNVLRTPSQNSKSSASHINSTAKKNPAREANPKEKEVQEKAKGQEKGKTQEKEKIQEKEKEKTQEKEKVPEKKAPEKVKVQENAKAPEKGKAQDKDKAQEKNRAQEKGMAQQKGKAQDREKGSEQKKGQNQRKGQEQKKVQERKHVVQEKKWPEKISEKKVQADKISEISAKTISEKSAENISEKKSTDSISENKSADSILGKKSTGKISEKKSQEKLTAQKRLELKVEKKLSQQRLKDRIIDPRIYEVACPLDEEVSRFVSQPIANVQVDKDAVKVSTFPDLLRADSTEHMEPPSDVSGEELAFETEENESQEPEFQEPESQEPESQEPESQEPEEPQHPLHNCWTLWYLENDRTKSWEEMLHEVTSIDTVENFWSLFSHIKPPSELKIGSDYCFFKKGIRPMWEDEANVHGGRWVISLNKTTKTDLDNFWMDSLLCLIGEACDNAAELCGAVVNIRGKTNKISIWTADGGKEEAVLEIGRKLREGLRMDSAYVLQYQLHKDTMVKQGSTVKSIFTLQ
ncbi:golgin subfamily A member 6-like protein 6 [Drosophila biarmipes]|uniref:golgin subfamily A member 6-like protein 6 n=1 Tax=Drosophila biarmipes TaxID=125945 RepID=UPI0007E6A010|nr:golgin subfamily A member 6-like protein 6 [Drosophila biarmipes]XP_050741883.1 golgin subfamily A member 6-like protein 6 [Drosophila biarmipes]